MAYQNEYRVLRLVLSFIGVANAVLFLAGQLGTFDWRLDLLAHFSQHYVVLMGLCAIGLLLSRNYRTAVFLGILLTPGMVLLYPYHQFQLSSSIDSDEPLSIVLFNVNSANREHQSVFDYLASTNADIIVLFETDARWIQALNPLTNAFDQALHIPASGNFGISVFSNAEIFDYKTVYAADADAPTLVANVQSRESQFLLIATHPVPPTSESGTDLRNRQLMNLAEISAEEETVILVGDLNLTPWSSTYRRFESSSDLVNCGHGNGVVLTWPTTERFFRIPIDHCLVSEFVDVRKIERGPDLGSDHFPVQVFLNLRGRESAT